MFIFKRGFRSGVCIVLRVKEYSSIIHKRQRQKVFDRQKAAEPVSVLMPSSCYVTVQSLLHVTLR